MESNIPDVPGPSVQGNFPTQGTVVVAQPVRRRPVWLFFVFGGLLCMLAVSMLMNLVFMASSSASAMSGANRLDEKVVSHRGEENLGAGAKIAIITIDGAILRSEGHVKHQIDRAREDEDVKAIVLRINSPGGTVTASDYLYHHLVELRKERNIPIVVSMGGICASGGYYIAMAVGDREKVIFAEPTTWTGSIGVIIPHYNFSGLMKEYGIEDDSISSHPLKETGSATKEMSPEQRAILQELVQLSFEGFKDIVKQGRPELDDQTKDEDGLTDLDKVATGQVFTAAQAEQRGLVDEIGFIEKAIDRAIELAGLDADEVQVVRYERPPSLLGSLLGAEARGKQPDLTALLELTTPRAYYLYSVAPALVSSGGQ
ncbi:MAG: signal peptide peptidase SppA [Planctomycetes bacterium]|nr:signal peptide peptidase SppA [Planctomycetota bacterium]